MWINNNADLSRFLTLMKKGTAAEKMKELKFGSLAGLGDVCLTFLDAQLFCAMSVTKELSLRQKISVEEFEASRQAYLFVRSTIIGLRALYTRTSADFFAFVKSLGIDESAIRLELLRAGNDMTKASKVLADSVQKRLGLLAEPAKAMALVQEVYKSGVGAALGLIYFENGAMKYNGLMLISVFANLLNIKDDLFSPFAMAVMEKVATDSTGDLITEDLISNVRQALTYAAEQGSDIIKRISL